MDGVSVDLFESSTHSYIIKIWLEESASEAGPARWRGRIIHVPSGQQHYFQNLDDILIFIAPYLEERGVQLKKGWQLSQWLKQWNRYLRNQH